MDFSIESAAERIQNSKTKEYFQEVVSSYTIGNYRSAVVMLYSVVIADLMYKMQDLEELYNDEKADTILTEIKTMQERNETSPEWEKQLVDMIKERLNLLSPIAYNHIVSLRNERNWSAHPVIENGYELHRPSREVARAHIRNMLEDVLIKPALLSKNIIGEIIKDVSERYKFFSNNELFEKYLTEKYFKYLPEAVKLELFKTLWKFIFCLNDKECEKNRDNNFAVVMFLYKHNAPIIFEYIKKDNQKVSKIISGIPMKYLYSFLCISPEIYNLLSKEAKTLLAVPYEKREFPYIIVAVFINNNFDEHVKLLDGLLKDTITVDADMVSAFHYLYLYAINYGKEKELINLLINLFSKSDTFDMSTKCYQYFISPYINKFGKEETEHFLSAFESNGQIYVNWNFNRNAIIKSLCEKTFTKEEIAEKYPNTYERLYQV